MHAAVMALRKPGFVLQPPNHLWGRPSTVKTSQVILYIPGGGGGGCNRCCYGMKYLDVGFVRYICTANEKADVKKYHYSQRIPKSKNIRIKRCSNALSDFHDGSEKKDPLAFALGDQVGHLDWWLDAERNMIKVFQQTSPSVVDISTSIDGSVKNLEIPAGSGTGIVWDTDGHIVTNYHVIMGIDNCRVTFPDTSTWEASVKGVAKNKDLAVLKIFAPPLLLKQLSVGSSQGLQVGQHVLAIGNPFGLNQTLTSGIISGIGRDMIGVTGVTIRDVIQTDASINPGNSGGPLLDSQGRLIGLNTAIHSAPSGDCVGISFAIPVNTVKRVVTDIIEHGKVTRAGLGIRLANDSQTRMYGVMGALVLHVRANSSAARSGIQGTRTNKQGRIIIGDIITAIDHQVIDNQEQLLYLLESRDVGEMVTVTIRRGNFIKHCNVVLEENVD